jgi:hypothetical protein
MTARYKLPQIIVAISISLSILPALAFANPVMEADCPSLCDLATNLCGTSCVPEGYNDCVEYCEENLDQNKIDCYYGSQCADFDNCLCGEDDDDDDDTTTDDDTQSGADNNISSDDDDDDGLFCSVSSSERSAALTLFMFAVGIVAFICSLSSSRGSRKKQGGSL